MSKRERIPRPRVDAAPRTDIMQGSAKCLACCQPFLAREAPRPSNQARIPLLLNCGHAFCETCLVKRAKQEVSGVCCPTCKVSMPLRDGAAGISCLPMDVYMVGQACSPKLRRSVSQVGLDFMNVSPELSSKRNDIEAKGRKKDVCGECSVREATCRCTKCECNMCMFCFDKVHKSSKILRKHISIPLYEDKSLAPTSAVCKLHDNRPIEYFCEDDVTAICSHCVIVGDHSKHSIIPMEVKNKSAIEELDMARKNSALVLRTLRRSHRTLTSVLPETRQSMLASREEVLQHFSRLHGQLQTREMEVLEKLGETFRKELDPLDRMKFMLREEISKVESSLKDVEAAMMDQQHLAVNAQQVLARLQSIQNTPCFLQCTRPETLPIHFTIDENFRKSLETVGSIDASWYLRLAVVPLKEVPAEELEGDDQDSTPSNSPCTSISRGTSWAEQMSENGFDDNSSILSSLMEASDSLRDKKRSKKNTYRRIPLTKNQQMTVLVTHVKNPCNFTVQRTEDLLQLEGLSQRIQTHCARPESPNDIPKDITEEMPVLAQFTTDNAWYRAQIRSVIISDEDPKNAKVEVTYMDYGNSEVLSVTRLRKMVPQFLKLPALAIHAALIDIVSADQSGHWPLESVGYFAEMTNEKPMLMHVMQETDDGQTMMVDLCKPISDDGADNRPVSVRDALIFLECAIYITPPVSDESKLFKGLRPCPQRQFIAPTALQPETTIQCCITHIESPYSFYINKAGDEAVHLVNLMMLLQKIYGHDDKQLWSVFYPQLDLVCVAQYELDNHWYRAQVVATPGRCNVDVLYVDFGNTARISHTKLRCIQPSLLILPKQATHCCLADVIPLGGAGWTTEAIARFNSFNFAEMRAVVNDVVDRQVHLVLYTVEGVCINQQLVADGLAISSGPASAMPDGNSPKSPLASVYGEFRPVKPADEKASAHKTRRKLLKKEKKEMAKNATPVKQEVLDVDEEDPNKPNHLIEAIVTHIENPGHLYVQLSSAPSDGLDELMLYLETTYTDSPVTQTSWEVDSHCVVRSPKDNKWYRGKVLEHTGNTYKALLLDYGSRIEVPASNLRPLEDVRDQHAYALRCHLSGVQPAGDPTQWSRTACEYLAEVTKDKIVFIESKGAQDEGSLPVDLKVTQQIEGDALNPERNEYPSLTDMLMDKGVALPNRRLTRQRSGPQVTVNPKAADTPPPATDSSAQHQSAPSSAQPQSAPDKPKPPQKPAATNPEPSDAVKEESLSEKPAAVKKSEPPSSSDLGAGGDSAPQHFHPPVVPSQDRLVIVPTYVDWDLVIYVHQVMDDEDMEGRYGFFLKEHTLETILQDNYLRRRGLYRARIPRDGNCLFRALAQGLYKDQGYQGQLRQTAVDHLARYWSELGEALGETNKDVYLAEMRRSGQYAGEPEIQAVCREFSVSVELVIAGLSHPVQVRHYNMDAGGKMVIRLVYVSDGNIDSGHYDLAVETAEDVTAINAVYQVARGVKIKEMREWPMYHDNTLYDDSLLNQLMEHLNKHYTNSDPDLMANWMVGQSVIAQFSQDKNYYRAMITGITHNNIKVKYIDFGNSETVSPDQLRKDVILTEIPQQCFTCVLHGIKFDNKDAMPPKALLDYAHKLLVNQQCDLQVVDRPLSPGQHLSVKITLPDGRDMASVLQEMLLPSPDVQLPPPAAPSPPLGAPSPTFHTPASSPKPNSEVYEDAEAGVEEEEVHVLQVVNRPPERTVPSPFHFLPRPEVGDMLVVTTTQVNAPNEVYVNPVQQDDTKTEYIAATNQYLHNLNLISATLNEDASIYPPLPCIKPGVKCCTQYSADNIWYRGEILSVKRENEVTLAGVLFVDYGNFEYLTSDRLRALPDDMVVLPAMAMLLHLEGLSPLPCSEGWSKEAYQLATSLYTNFIHLARVKSIHPRIEVELYDYSVCLNTGQIESRLSQPLVDAGLACMHDVTEDGTVVECDEYLEDAEILQKQRKQFHSSLIDEVD